MASISSRLQFLSQFIKIPPAMWDIIFPHGPLNLSVAMREYMIAGVLRDLGNSAADGKFKEPLMAAGKELATFSSKNLVQSWEDGDICPPWWPWPRPRPRWPFPFPWPGPFPGPWPGGGPFPDPWMESGNQFEDLEYEKISTRYLSSALTVLSELTSVKEVAAQLNKLGSEIGKGR